jgi:hypothetical protein
VHWLNDHFRCSAGPQYSPYSPFNFVGQLYGRDFNRRVTWTRATAVGDEWLVWIIQNSHHWNPTTKGLRRVSELVMRDHSAQTLTRCPMTEICSFHHPDLHFYGIFTAA